MKADEFTAVVSGFLSSGMPDIQDLPLSGGNVPDVIARDPATNGSYGTLPQLIIVDYNGNAACAAGP